MAWPEQRLVALGDDVFAGGGEDGPGCLSFLAARLGMRASSLAEEGATSREIRREQLPLAIAMRPERTILCVGTPEALRHLHEAAFGNAAFLGPILADVRAMTERLRAADSGVVLVRPPTLDAAPAAWLRFGRQRPAHGLDTPRMLRTALQNLRDVGRAWSEALCELALGSDSTFVDLSLLFDEVAIRGGDEVGLPPCSGASMDLFADPIRLSTYGAALAAERLVAAFGCERLAWRSAGASSHC